MPRPDSREKSESLCECGVGHLPRPGPSPVRKAPYAHSPTSLSHSRCHPRVAQLLYSSTHARSAAHALASTSASAPAPHQPPHLPHPALVHARAPRAVRQYHTPTWRTTQLPARGMPDCHLAPSCIWVLSQVPHAPAPARYSRSARVSPVKCMSSRPRVHPRARLLVI